MAGPSGIKRDIRGGLVNDDEAMARNKGKGKEISRPILKSVGSFRQPLLPLRLEQMSKVRSKSDITPASNSIIHNGGETEVIGTDWQAESKRRKGIWRDLILADSGYEMMWSVIPRVSHVAAPTFETQLTS